MSDSLNLPVPFVQAAMDSSLGNTLVQTLLMGLYIAIFWNAIVPLIKDGKRKIYAAILISLFAVIITNFATTWILARSIFVVHDENRDSMALELFTGSDALTNAGVVTSCVAVIIADSLLCWRCYVLWQRNKWMLGVFIIIMSGELALIPMLVVLKFVAGPGHFPLICVFFFISIGVTILATALITYRVVDVARLATGQTRSTYQYTLEILIESGVMYSATLLITGVLMVVGGRITATSGHFPVFQASSYWSGILTPVTGIAPTLIALRISRGTARDEKEWSQPVSAFYFRRYGTENNTVLSTLDCAEVTFSKISSTDVESQEERK